MRYLTFNRRSVVLTWLFSYLAILFLPVVFSIILYIQSSSMLKSEINEANNFLLMQVREIMDNYVQATARLNFEMTWNLQVQELLNSNKYTNSPNEYTYDLYRITNEFSLMSRAYTSVDFFYMYIAEDRAVVLPGTVRNAAFAYETLISDESLPYNKWISILNSRDSRGFQPMVRIDENGKVRKTIAYLNPVTSNKEGVRAATNVIMIDQTRILGAIQNVERFNKGYVLILNRNNEVLFSNTDEPFLNDFPYEMLANGNKFIYSKKNDGKYEVESIQSDSSGLKYVSMIPSSLYWQKAEHMRTLTYSSILLSLLGGGLLTYYFLRKSYNPVRRLVQSVSGKANIGLGHGHNEFHFIEQAIGSTMHEMKQMVDQMKSLQYILRSNFIARLMKGRIDSQGSIKESLTTFNMKLNSNDFAVLLLYVEAKETFYERHKGLDAGEKQKLLQFIVGNVVEELANRCHSGYVTEIDELLGCLVSISPKDLDECKEDIARIAKESQDFLNTHYQIDLTLSISSIVYGIEGISKAYLEALDAMEYKLVMGSKEIISYEELQKTVLNDTEIAYYFPLQVEHQLINYLKTGDFTRSKETLDEIIHRNMNQSNVSVAVVRCLMLDLVSTMMKTVIEIGNGLESSLFQNPKKIEELTSCETIQDMHQQMTEIFKKVCEFTSSKRQQNIEQARVRTLNELVDHVKTFIQQHYPDINLNISMIGNHFDMKSYYLSKLFKDQTGEGLLDYINKVRIERAKEMIRNREKNIKQIANCVGFTEVTVFIRIFKKYEGITPGKYKEILDE